MARRVNHKRARKRRKRAFPRAGFAIEVSVIPRMSGVCDVRARRPAVVDGELLHSALGEPGLPRAEDAGIHPRPADLAGEAAVLDLRATVHHDGDALRPRRGRRLRRHARRDASRSPRAEDRGPAPRPPAARRRRNCGRFSTMSIGAPARLSLHVGEGGRHLAPEQVLNRRGRGFDRRDGRTPVEEDLSTIQLGRAGSPRRRPARWSWWNRESARDRRNRQSARAARRRPQVGISSPGCSRGACGSGRSNGRSRAARPARHRGCLTTTASLSERTSTQCRARRWSG